MEAYCDTQLFIDGTWGPAAYGGVLPALTPQRASRPARSPPPRARKTRHQHRPNSQKFFCFFFVHKKEDLPTSHPADTPPVRQMSTAERHG
jgi:hypothetical protein